MARRWFGRGDGADEIFSTHVRKFSYASLRTATDNFSDGKLIGQGGSAKIYRGVLGDGRVVAVKKYRQDRRYTSGAEFLNDTVVMSHINHRNINQVIGCCIERGHQLLVSNYEENGNVYELLHGQGRKESFHWDVRASVLVGIARGLCYIHEDSTPGIIHRDIKTSNILLDANFTPKITDFDLPVFFHDSRELPFDELVVGTIGYLDPEYYQSSMISEKVDVYGFGVVMLEIISGRKVIASSQDYDGDDRLITRWASKLAESYRVREIVDPVLLDIPLDVVRRFIDVALLCTQLKWGQRPSMHEVVLLLQGVCDPCRRWSAMLRSEDGSHSFQGEVDATHGHLRKSSYATLCTATDNFSNERLIGGNDSAQIYKGILEDGTSVIVKKYYEQEQQQQQQQGGGTHFLRIYEVMSGLIHQNITKTIGCCVEEDHQLLVTEYPENGSLHDLLHDPVKRESIFNWHMRAAVLIGIAQALSHLHKSVIHRNISSSCIHLDSHFTPKIADFDNADYFHDSNVLPRTAPIVGTMGYMDPEYLVSRGEYTEKVDIYAFGVVALEIISGRNCINWEFGDADYLISDWASKRAEGDGVMEIVDPLLSDFPSDIARRVIDVVLLCTQSDSRLRPIMQEVVVMLRVACNSYVPPRRIYTPALADAKEIENEAESQGITELESSVVANASSDLDEITGCSDVITPIVDNIVRGERAESSRAREYRGEDRVINGSTEDQVQITTDPGERMQQRRKKKMEFGVVLSGSDDVVERLSQTMVFKRYSDHVCPEAVYPPFLTSAYPIRARQRRR